MVEQEVICVTADERENAETFIQHCMLFVNTCLKRISTVPGFNTVKLEDFGVILAEFPQLWPPKILAQVNFKKS